MTKQDDLIKMYSNKSKHSNYQVLPSRLLSIINPGEITTTSRYENERLNFILNNIGVANKSILDVGGNTGYFAFELIEAGAKSVHIIEGNKEHADFVKLAAEVVGIANLTVTNAYYSFEEKESYNIVLLLNVLHHLGDDYGDKKISIDQAKKMMIDQLNSFCGKVDTIVFQLGYNWHGNIDTPLFQNGTKQELIDFVTKGVKDKWDILAIGIPVREINLVYQKLNDNNIARDDSLGEFLNRPLFILEAK